MNPSKLLSQPFIKNYDGKAGKYECRWQKYLVHTHKKLLAELESEEGDYILDISAGTGLFAKYALEEGKKFSKLVLNDVSSEMLEIAKKRFSEHPQVVFSSSPAESLNLKSKSFDSVICLNAFHHYEHQERALSEICRVLKPGGNVYMLDWNREGFFKIVNGLIKHIVKDPIHTLSAKEMRERLLDKELNILNSKGWRFGYWKFFLYKAQKKRE